MTPERFEELITTLLTKAKEFYENGEDAKMYSVTNWLSGALYIANKFGICTSPTFLASTYKSVRELQRSVESKKREVDAIIKIYEDQFEPPINEAESC